jgi:Tol biopolymer transport system component
VPRSIAALAALAALVTAVPSAAQVGSGRIAYATNTRGIYTVAADGRESVVLKSGNVFLPRWSPDGSRIAFIKFPPIGVQLRVMNADGTDDHVVASDDTFSDISLSEQPWSPDGNRLAWGPAPIVPGVVRGGDIYTASANGGEIRSITTDGHIKEPPVWSPTAPQLTYASMPSAGLELFTARDDGSDPVQITNAGAQSWQPSWSPSGASIAFVRTARSESAIYVVRPDGTELHRVAGFYGDAAGEPAWSPDGSKLAYTSTENGNARYGGQEVFLVNADGSGERRLTELGPRTGFDAAPTWSPDGDQIVLTRRGISFPVSQALWTMNPDGTCESALASADVWGSPSWQPVPGGPTSGPKTCRAVAIEATQPQPPDANGSEVLVGGTVSNEGTEALSNVIVTISPVRSDFSLEASAGDPCTRIGSVLVCRIERLNRSESQHLFVLGKARRVGRNPSSRSVALSAKLKVTADGPLLATMRETDYVLFKPSRCETRDRGGGHIEGTQFPDRICGRRGADDINPRDRKDYVYAGDGPDVIHSRDIYGDMISCGRGRDLVFADRMDRVSRDCERVRRG